MEQVANPGLWAQVGGLNGLVILALFTVLYVFVQSSTKIFDKHREDLRNLLDMHAKERVDWGRIMDMRQQETNAAINGVTAAITKMVMRSRRGDIENDHDQNQNHY